MKILKNLNQNPDSRKLQGNNQHQLHQKLFKFEKFSAAVFSNSINTVWNEYTDIIRCCLE